MSETGLVLQIPHTFGADQKEREYLYVRSIMPHPGIKWCPGKYIQYWRGYNALIPNVGERSTEQNEPETNDECIGLKANAWKAKKLETILNNKVKRLLLTEGQCSIVTF